MLQIHFMTADYLVQLVLRQPDVFLSEFADLTFNDHEGQNSGEENLDRSIIGKLS